MFKKICTIILIFLLMPHTVFAQETDWDLTLPSLAETFNEYFLFGNIWSNRGQMGDPTTVDKYIHHYNTITASNLHKVDAVLGAAPNAWDWNWETADYIVDFAEENDMAMVWHTLVWHTQSRAWLTTVPGTIEPLTRAEAIENMHRFIRTVAERYSGRIFAYDVVNEAIYAASWPMNMDWRQNMRRTGHGLEDDNLTRTRWYDAFANGAVGDECGSDYVYYAFRFARIYDPFAVLYYNDYNEFERNKREAIAQMVEQINERWRDDPLYDGRLLIEGIGMQSHYNLRNWPGNMRVVRDAIERFIATGARISITELNVYLEGGGIVPTDDALPELFVEQATRYSQLFNMYLNFADYIERVTFFIWQDLPAQQGAWRRWPHSQHPALFDLNRQAKPAFHAVIEAAEDRTANISVPFVNPDYLLGEHPERFAIQLSVTQNNFAPVLWRVESGQLPPGLELIPTTGVIMGNFETSGDYSFTIAAENARGYGMRIFTIRASGDEVTVTADRYPLEPIIEEYIAEPIPLPTPNPTPSPTPAPTPTPTPAPTPVPSEEITSTLRAGLIVPVLLVAGIIGGAVLLIKKRSM